MDEDLCIRSRDSGRLPKLIQTVCTNSLENIVLQNSVYCILVGQLLPLHFTRKAKLLLQHISATELIFILVISVCGWYIVALGIFKSCGLGSNYHLYL